LQVSAPVIFGTVVDYSTNQITINGPNFSPTGLPPAVKFPCSTLTLVSFTSQSIVANLPAGVASGACGISVSNSNTQVGFLDVTLGVVGPDGANVRVTSAASNFVTKLRASDGARLGTFSVGGQFPTGVIFDGASIWFANGISNVVSKLCARDGTLPGEIFRSPGNQTERSSVRRRQHLGGDLANQQRQQAAGQRRRVIGRLFRRELSGFRGLRRRERLGGTMAGLCLQAIGRPEIDKSEEKGRSRQFVNCAVAHAAESSRDRSHSRLESRGS
jgi:hypothetical protein